MGDDKIPLSFSAHGPVELSNGVCLMKGDYAGFKVSDEAPQGVTSGRHARYFLMLPALSLDPDIVDVTSEVERGLLSATP